MNYIVSGYGLTNRKVAICETETESYEIARSRKCSIIPGQTKIIQYTYFTMWILLKARELGEMGYYLLRNTWMR